MIFAIQLVHQQGADEDVQVLEQLQSQAHPNGDRRHLHGIDLAVGQEPINQKEHEDGERHGGDLEQQQSQPGGQLALAGPGRNPLAVIGGKDERQQDQRAARENHAQADDLILPVAAVCSDTPGAIERHFERLENAVRGDQQEKDGSERKVRHHPGLEVLHHHAARLAREAVANGEVDRVDGGRPVQHVAE